VGSVTTSRPYRSALREQQAEQTRELIAAAARARFLEKGWSGTSVRSVAAEAGVSEATIYAVYGSKAGLASSLIDAAEQRADVRRAVAELEQHAGDPLAQLGVLVAFDRRLYEVGGDVLRLAGEARRQHPDLAAAFDDGRRRGDTVRAKVFGGWPRTVWRADVDVEKARSVYALLVSLEAYDVATTERGWTPEQIERWWHASLAELLLADGLGRER
jgi:AcrR family transcriptional regulator